MPALPIAIHACLDALQSRAPELHACVLAYLELHPHDFPDILGTYLEWRAQGRTPRSFLATQLAARGIRSALPAYGGRIVQRMLDAGGHTLLVHDDTTIAAALAQLVVDGKTPPFVRARACTCLERQQLPAVLQHRGHADLRLVQACLRVVQAGMVSSR